MHYATQLLTTNLVVGFPHQRLSALAEQITTNGAQICAVLKPLSFALLGVVRFSDVAAHPGLATRILADLMLPPPACQVYGTDLADKVVDLLVTHNPPEVVVVDFSGGFIGLITPESFHRWILAVSPAAASAVRRIPAGSRWSPFPATASFEEVV